jgi:hypothetical protein
MKRTAVLCGIVFFLLTMGFAAPPVIPKEGIYPVKLKNLTIFELQMFESSFGKTLTREIMDGMMKMAELSEAKPETLAVQFDYTKLRDYRFGSFKFGNNEQRVWFIMSKDKNDFWSDFYIDQDQDNQITMNERISETIEVFEFKQSSTQVKNAFTMIPVKLRLSYKGLSGVLEKNTAFFIHTYHMLKKGQSETLVYAIGATFLDGEIQVQYKNEPIFAKFRILDGNSNGCFNDFGKDILMVDLDYDGYYKKGEIMRLPEFFDLPVSRTEKKQLRMIVLPLPAKIAIIGATEDIDRSQLEPASDKRPEEEKKLEASPKPPVII